MAVNCTSDRDSEMRSWYSRIEEELERVSDQFGNQQWFLPTTKINGLVNPRSVDHTLSLFGVEKWEDISKFVLTAESRIVFLILARIEYVEGIKDLYNDNFSDRDLPVIWKRGSQGVRSLNEYSNSGKAKLWTAFSKWKPSVIDAFCERQWLFLAPTFTGNTLHYKFDTKRPLPFTSTGASPKSGYFSNVYEVGLHHDHLLGFTEAEESEKAPDHQVAAKDLKLKSTAEHKVAVKVLKPDQDIDKVFKKELENFERIVKIQHPHLIKPIAAFERGLDRFFMFPWASGGNLWEFWNESREKTPPALEKGLVIWALEQMCGLSDCIKHLYEANDRHGDIKPENILLFRSTENTIGKLVIADFGLMKFHLLKTRQRDAQTSTKHGTYRYEPPEIDREEPLSRCYDTWSMGCIFMEFLVWLIYGKKSLKEFRKPLQAEKFWQAAPDQHVPGEVKYDLHKVVLYWLRKLTSDLTMDTALRDVLDLVKNRLLVVDLAEEEIVNPECDGKTPANGRCTAPVLASRMKNIWLRARNIEAGSTYVFDFESWKQIRPPARPPGQTTTSSNPNNLAVPGQQLPAQCQNQNKLPHRFGKIDFTVSDPTESEQPHHSQEVFPLSSNENSITNYTTSAVTESFIKSPPKADSPNQRTSNLRDRWTYETDNQFARKLFRHPQWAPTTPLSKVSLCKACTSYDFGSSALEIPMEPYILNQKPRNCSVCKLIHDYLSRHNPSRGRIQRLVRVGPTLSAYPGGMPVLSIYTDPGTNATVPDFCQLGTPILPEPGSVKQTGLLSEWLSDCDSTHECVSPKQTSDPNPKMPTRVIYVGQPGNSTLRLVERGNLREKYIALSHCWGKIDDSLRLCTYRHNFDDNIEKIDYKQLPQTFKDAVRVTQALGIQYLWIDSICIIQQDDEDWNREAGKMESVFSSAYCTLSASSATSSIDGFLKKKRPSRPYVAFPIPDTGTMYIAPSIDDFHGDVESSILNSRGWVFQERALSRRIIHFTSNQVYWECGEGVHCETLTKMKNSQAAFLGDSDFPNSGLQYFKDERIRLVQHLYRQYSHLAFTKEKDRSAAIIGLQNRLAKAFASDIHYGVLQRHTVDSYLQRTLLWESKTNCGMGHIVYPDDRKVPSWSWMAYMGEIKYMEIKFGNVDWTEDLEAPPTFKPSGDVKELWAIERDLVIPGDEERKDVAERITFDAYDHSANLEALKCVVIGQEKQEEGVHERINYTLLIKPSSKGGASVVYERVGVGYLLPSHVSERGGRVCIA